MEFIARDLYASISTSKSISFTDEAWLDAFIEEAHDGLGGDAGLSEDDDGDEVAMPPIIGVGMIGRLGEAPGEE